MLASHSHSIILVLLALLLLLAHAAWADFEHFVTVDPADRSRLMDGDEEFRFVGVNSYLQTRMAVGESQGHTGSALATPFEQEDGIKTLAQMGGRVARVGWLDVSLDPEQDAAFTVLQNPESREFLYPEAAWQVFDRVLYLANQHDVRLVIWLQNYADPFETFRGQPHNQGRFFTYPEIIEDYKAIFSHIAERTNSITGVKYKDDKAILCWETGNEFYPHPEQGITTEMITDWTREVTAHMKAVDPNHLVMDGYTGFNAPDWGGPPGISPASMTMESVDIVTNHYYFEPHKWVSQYRTDREASYNVPPEQRKVLVIGELGYGWGNRPAAGDYRMLLQAIQDDVSGSGTGALLWSLSHHLDGGGYLYRWEDAGFRRYRWPGFPDGEEFDETDTMNTLREFAYSIRGSAAPPLSSLSLDPPRMLQPACANSIAWQGSAGARSYEIQRASTPDGPWQTISADASDADNTFPFEDAEAAQDPEQAYYYRVKAKRTKDGVESGWSDPTAVPVRCVFLAGSPEGTIYEENAAGLAAQGWWATKYSSAFSGESSLSSCYGGSRLSFSFKGTRARIYGTTLPAGPPVHASLDGQAPEPRQTESEDEHYRQLLYDTGVLSRGEHTIVLEVEGAPMPVDYYERLKYRTEVDYVVINDESSCTVGGTVAGVAAKGSGMSGHRITCGGYLAVKPP